MISGPAGNLESVIGPPITSKKKLLGIICHPHPLFEGTMNNKVVTTIARAFRQLDIVPVRFNFRGVGDSEGQFDYGLGEMEDLKAVIKEAEKTYSDYALLLAGFSFGSYIAMKVATEINPKALITIAPPVNHQDFANLPPVRFPWIVVQGDKDEIVPPAQVFDWLKGVPVKPTLLKMQGVSHFFHGHLTELRDELVNILSPVL